MSEAGDPFRV